jgi:hypothetical protein
MWERFYKGVHKKHKEEHKRHKRLCEGARVVENSETVKKSKIV